MSQQSIGVAVIGAGMAGRAHCAGYRSAPTLFDPPLPPIHYAAVIDANEAIADDAAARYGYERHGTDWRDLLAADDVQVVSVVVANALHREIVEALLAAGKHVLCEKPLADSLEDAQAMVDAASRPPRPGHRHRLRLPPPAGRRRHPRPGARRARRGVATSTAATGATTPAARRPRWPGATRAGPAPAPSPTSAATSSTSPSSSAGR